MASLPLQNKNIIKTTHWLPERNEEKKGEQATKINEMHVIWQIYKVNDACYSKQKTQIHTTILK